MSSNVKAGENRESTSVVNRKRGRREDGRKDTTQHVAMTVQLADDGDAIDSFLEPLWKHITPHDYHPALDGATVCKSSYAHHSVPF